MLFNTFILETVGVEKHHADADERLILALARGDTNAMHDLYHATHVDIYGFALSIVKNHADAEDIMQETYLKIYSGAPNYQPMGKPMAWIFTIVRNLALSKLRDKKNSHLPIEDNPELDLDPICSPHASVEDKLLLKAAVTVLSDEERQIIMLHIVSGLKHREISELLEMNLSTVLSKYHRGLKKMRQQLKEV